MVYILCMENSRKVRTTSLHGSILILGYNTLGNVSDCYRCGYIIQSKLNNAKALNKNNFFRIVKKTDTDAYLGHLMHDVYVLLYSCSS